jgi:5-methyltetrahydrofolate--homocysteine methyltransferase
VKPPFFDTKVIEDIDVRHVFDLIDREVLFGARWQLRGDLSGEAWHARVKEVAEPTFEKLAAHCLAHNVIQPKIVYGFFHAENNGNLLFVKHLNRSFSFDFPRERKIPNRCLADFFPDKFVTIQMVTVGTAVAEAGAKFFKENKYTDAFFLKGFAAEATEALANYAQRYIANELDLPDDAGTRFSFGYPPCPNLMDQKKLYELLQAKRIGVRLSHTMHLIPEHSTSALVSFSDAAARFIP